MGAALGVGLSFGLVRLLEELPAVKGILDAQFTAGDVWRALYTAGIIGVAAATYPAWRAGRLQPLDAMRRE
jgi:ABC-type lipoprotein release transport system permease subunit